jgi:hypothetical protein
MASRALSPCLSARFCHAAAALLAEFSTDFSATASHDTAAQAKRDMADYYERLRLRTSGRSFGTYARCGGVDLMTADHLAR